ncbi:rod-determining factor RdfA [Halosimplex halophilum]|uniref:rod-determining factor RdfA n=1 Tax=Halosimplex halophilum TaxID=2559572 RepID=UPI00107F227C|nr:rod-determining factor RdfA [Halosimplex halophilum]
MGSEDAVEGRRSKVERLVAAYGLDGMGDELVDRWTGSEGSRTSLRDLADEFNRALLRAALRRAGRNPTEHAVAEAYETLADDDASEGRKAEVRNDLSRAGVDVDALRDDFVSHQAVHTYLTEVRGATPPESTADPVATDVESLQRLVGRTTTVAQGTLARHRDADRVTLGEFDVFLDLRVLCHDCGADRDAVSLLRDGGCACDDDRAR